MLGFQLNETLDGVGFFVSVNYSVVRSAHKDQIGEGVPLGVCLPLVLARSARVGSLDVADLATVSPWISAVWQRGNAQRLLESANKRLIVRSLGPFDSRRGATRPPFRNKLLLGHH